MRAFEMTKLLTSAQMRAVEAPALAAGAPLMRRAGRALAERAATRAGGAAGRALVLCGPGNNGGDGYVAASRLRACGWQVAVLALAPPRSADAVAAAAGWGAGAGALVPEAVAAQAGADLVIDAVFGTGLERPLSADLCTTLAAVRGGVVVAADAPSGLCLDSGRALVATGGGVPLPADLTVSFHALKPGHVLSGGPAACGVVSVADIGLPDEDADGDAGAEVARLVGPLPALLDKGARGSRPGGHKYDHGHALVLAGGPGQGGAARLAARAALRVGAGLVTLGCPPGALTENAARLDAVMLRPVADAGALGQVLEDHRFNALCLGPGLGLGEASADLVAAVLATGRGAVLDADALTVFAADPAALFARLHPGVVLTPHGGEFARLFPDIAARLAATPEGGPAFSRLDAARAAAARSGAVVLLKGPDTVIAAPDGRALVHAAAYGRAAPWLATAGAGDVLAGTITGLLARGLAPLAAAGQAAWLHVEAARSVGPGLIAEDLTEALPGVFRQLFAQPPQSPPEPPPEPLPTA